MKILILGSGQVGSTIAQELAAIPNHDVTIIDTDGWTCRPLSATARRP